MIACRGKLLALANSIFLCYCLALTRGNAILSQRPKGGGLSTAEFHSIIHSNIYQEFAFHDDGMLLKSEELWDAATEMEWTRALRLELACRGNDRTDLGSCDDINHPYVACNPENGKSGHMTRRTLEKAGFGYNIRVIYNKSDKSCFYVEALPSVASNAPANLKVQPIMPEMKLIFNMHFTHAYQRLGVLLSPGAAATPQEALDIGHSIIDSLADPSALQERFLRQDYHQHLQEPKHLSALKEYHQVSRRVQEWHEAFSQDCHDQFSGMSVFANDRASTIVFETKIKLTEVSDHFKRCFMQQLVAASLSRKVSSVSVMPQNFEVLNANAQWIHQSNVEEYRPLFDVGLTGKGQIISVSDTGIDEDNCYFWDAKNGPIKKDGTVDMKQRKIIQYVPYADSDEDEEGHGTHVCGTVAGHRSVNGKAESIGAADGMAKDAKISFFDIGLPGSWLDVPPNPEDILKPGKKAGAKIHSASWGAWNNTYSLFEEAWDQFSYDNDDFLIVAAAGNYGDYNGMDTKYSILSPATAKNVLTVGACESEGYDLESGMLGHEYLAYFSSRGPTYDGRTKPDIIATGYYLTSACARRGSLGECDDTDGLMKMAGTSMATPATSGLAALVRQYFEEGYYPSGKPNEKDAILPTSALVKAVLMNGAQSLIAANNQWYGITPLEDYDVNQNFGRINLLHSLPLKGKNTIKAYVENRKPIDDGESQSVLVEIDQSDGCNATHMSATLVWTDVAAVPGCTDCRMDNLDLFVTKVGNSTRIYPNGLNKRDDKNLAERVRLQASDGDAFIVTIQAWNLQQASQNYALVVTGCIGTVSPSTQPPTPAPTTPAPTEPKDFIETNFDGLEFQSGFMFDIRAETNVAIAGLSIHIPIKFELSVSVYTRAGSYVEFIYSPSEWTMLGVVSVTGKGLGKPTHLPHELFEGLEVPAGGRQAFYISTQSNYMVGSKASYEDAGREYTSNQDIAIYYGSVSYPNFGGEYSDPFLWNGIIRYDRLPSPTLPPTSSPSLDYDSITTNYDGDVVQSGNMFDVYAKKDLMITEIDFNTRSNGNSHEDHPVLANVTVEIYTKEGSYKGYENDRYAWNLTAKAVVPGKGKGKATSFPKSNMPYIVIKAEETRAFYMTLTTPDMVYSVGSSSKDKAASNSDIKIMQGNGIVYPFGATFSPRIWNGSFKYSPIVLTKTIETVFDGTWPIYGSMFDVKARNDITIVSMSVNSALGEGISFDLEIYTKKGSYKDYQNDPSAWELIAMLEVIGSGYREPTPIPKGSMVSVVINAGETQAFYVTGKNSALYGSYAKAEGEIFVANSDIEIMQGTDIRYPFGTNYYYSTPIVWNGAFEYVSHAPVTSTPTTIHTIFPTPSSFDMPTLLPTPSGSSTIDPTHHHSTFSPTPLPSTFFPTPSGSNTIDPTHPLFTPAPTSVSPATLSPSMFSTSSWSPFGTDEPTSAFDEVALTTTFKGKTIQSGNMFDIYAKDDIRIIGFDINTRSNGQSHEEHPFLANVTVKIYTKAGTYIDSESRRKDWDMIGKAVIAGMGEGNRTSLPSDMFEPVFVGAHETQAFYITLTTPDLVYTKTKKAVGKVYTEDSDLQIMVGNAVNYPFGRKFSPRVWNGSIRYLTLKKLNKESDVSKDWPEEIKVAEVY